MDPKALIYILLIVGYLMFELYSRNKQKQQQDEKSSSSGSRQMRKEDVAPAEHEMGPKGPDQVTTEKEQEPDPFDPFDQWFKEAGGERSSSDPSQSPPIEQDPTQPEPEEHQIPTYRRTDFGAPTHAPQSQTQLPEEDWQYGETTEIPETRSGIPKQRKSDGSKMLHQQEDDEMSIQIDNIEEEQEMEAAEKPQITKLEEFLDGPFDARKAIIYSEVINRKYF